MSGETNNDATVVKFTTQVNIYFGHRSYAMWIFAICHLFCIQIEAAELKGTSCPPSYHGSPTTAAVSGCLLIDRWKHRYIKMLQLTDLPITCVYDWHLSAGCLWAGKGVCVFVAPASVGGRQLQLLQSLRPPDSAGSEAEDGLSGLAPESCWVSVGPGGVQATPELDSKVSDF